MREEIRGEVRKTETRRKKGEKEVEDGKRRKKIFLKSLRKPELHSEFKDSMAT